MKDRVRYFLVPPEEISYVDCIVHSYDGLAVVRTVDGRLGLIEMLIAPDMEEELSALIHDLACEMSIRELSPGEAAAMGEHLDICPI